MAFVVRRCRELYNAALAGAQRGLAEVWRERHGGEQSAQLPAIKEVRPEYRDIHSQVLQDVLTRLDRAFQAFFRRIREGRDAGISPLPGSNRYNSFTYKQFGNGADAG